MRYTVYVDNNYYYMDESYRYSLGEFDCCESAVAACKKVVDDFLLPSWRPGITPEELFRYYSTNGEDPFIISDDKDCNFSAFDYARRRCRAICE